MAVVVVVVDVLYYSWNYTNSSPVDCVCGMYRCGDLGVVVVAAAIAAVEARRRNDVKTCCSRSCFGIVVVACGIGDSFRLIGFAAG